MDELVFCELLKMKRQKIKIIVFLGIFVPPVLSLFSSVRNRESGISLFTLYDNAFMFFMLLFGPLVFSVIAAYLFSREFTEKILKTILVIPIERKKFIQCKFVTLFISIMTLILGFWMLILFIYMICSIFVDVNDFSFGIALGFLFKVIFGGILLFFTMMPMAALAFRTKGIIAPMIAAATIALINVILSGSSLAGFFPWIAPYLIVNARMSQTVCPLYVSVLIIIALAYASYRYCYKSFEREDI